MVHQILWSNQEATGLEHCYLRHSATEITADGLVIGVEEGVAFRIRYQVCCDLGWQVRKVVVTSLDETATLWPMVWATGQRPPASRLPNWLAVWMSILP